MCPPIGNDFHLVEVDEAERSFMEPADEVHFADQEGGSDNALWRQSTISNAFALLCLPIPMATGTFVFVVTVLAG